MGNDEAEKKGRLGEEFFRLSPLSLVRILENIPDTMAETPLPSYTCPCSHHFRLSPTPYREQSNLLAQGSFARFLSP